MYWGSSGRLGSPLPPRERRPEGTEQHLVPKPDTPVHAVVQIREQQQLMLVEPAADGMFTVSISRPHGRSACP